MFFKSPRAELEREVRAWTAAYCLEVVMIRHFVPVFALVIATIGAAHTARADYFAIVPVAPDPAYLGSNTPVSFTVPDYGPIEMRNLQLTKDTSAPAPTPLPLSSPPETSFTADSLFDVFFEISIDSGGNWLSGTGGAPVHVKGTVSTTAGRFDTEMLQMDISGNSTLGSIKFRESPTKQSLGTTTVAGESGDYVIDSFFDVFTELSLDGGANWIPQNESQGYHLNAMPEPGTLSLLALGVLPFLRRRR